MRRIPTHLQLAFGFSLVVGVFLATLGLVAWQLSTLTAAVTRFNERTLPEVLKLESMNLSRSDVQQFLTDVSATHDPEGYKDAQEAAERFAAGTRFLSAAYRAEGQRELPGRLDALQQRFDAFYAGGQRMAKAYLSEGLEAGNRLMKGSDGVKGFDALSEDLQQDLDALREQRLGAAQQEAAAAQAASQQLLRWMGVGAGVAVLLAGALATWLVRNLQRRLGSDPRVVSRLTQRVAEGDLQVQIRLEGARDTSLLAGLHHMVGNLRGMVRGVRDESQGVAASAALVAASAQELSQRAESQAAALEQTAQSMNSLREAVQRNHEEAVDAQRVAREMRSVAQEGGAQVGAFVGTMQSIQEASRKIADIIGTIDGIAFQTNILALNAAVEAARAGESGRGFAVVAGEVRNLAGRSAEAAREIKGLIAASVERVEQGHAMVAQASGTMQRVVDGVQAVSGAMDHISQASGEQQASVNQISETVQHLEQLTQQYAAMVEELAAAGTDMQTQADRLVGSVSAFRV